MDVTARAGITFRHDSGAFGKKYLPETLGSGACFLDYDGDGWQDLLLVNSASSSALYRNNRDGTFTDVTRDAGLEVEMYGLGCAAADFDNDGRVDLYLTGVGGNRLLRNLGDGRFADVTARAGVADAGFSTGAAWLDYDHDGRLDLFVAHYVEWSIETDPYCTLDGKHKSYCTPQRFKGESPKLYRNRGDGTFEDVTRRAGVFDAGGKALGIALLDYDDDGRIDLFVANDTEPNRLYRNNGNGTFREVGAAAGVAYADSGTARAGMGTDAGDHDNSGRQGLLVGNFTDEGLALYRNEGAGLFADLAGLNGMRRLSLQSLTFATFFFDYDLDGRLDVLAVNGHISDDVSVVQPHMKHAQPPQLFRNLGAGRFEESTARHGKALPLPVVGRGAAYADIDNDGDLDLVITANNGAARLLRNDQPRRNDALRVRLEGTRSNRDGIGAQVTVASSTGPRLRAMVKSGSSYLSQSELPLTFGLGPPQAAKTLELEIAWPSGRRDTLKNLAPNQSITVVEGKGAVAALPLR